MGLFLRGLGAVRDNEMFEALDYETVSGTGFLKKLVWPGAALVVAAAAFLCYRAMRRDFAGEARAARAGGEYAQAISLYARGALEQAPSLDLPDRNRAKILDEQAWRNEVGRYLEWITGNKAQKSASALSDFVEGIALCTAHVENEHFVTGDPDFPARVFNFEKHWYDAFFPPFVERGNHAGLIEEAKRQNVSIFHLASIKGFTYDLALLSLSSGKSVTFKLYPESEVYFLASPGNYFLICSGKVTFPNGQVWQSEKNVIPLASPDTTSVQSLALKTHVRRERK